MSKDIPLAKHYSCFLLGTLMDIKCECYWGDAYISASSVASAAMIKVALVSIAYGAVWSRTQASPNRAALRHKTRRR
jgi:hypothetical protein